MKISYNWLKEYIQIDIEPNKIAELLTNSGLEVEGIEKIQSVKGGLEGIIIGKILTKEKHPDADRLNLTTVDIGKDNPLHIVCGAPNVDKGQKVVVATVGTTLYNGNESFKIKKSKIRGEISEGMICAEDEIGLGSSHDGIMILEDNAKIGQSAKDYFNIQDDVVFEIGLTPNRSDATGHIGVARDLAAVLSLKKPTQIKIPSIHTFSVDNTSLKIDVEIKNIDACPRYAGVIINNIKVKDSPDWLKNKLISIGLTPINNIVDITNFVLHETGQPLHAFDTDKIKGNKIIVRNASDKTKFVTLDGIERELTKNDLMICDTEKELCIAGVFGGMDSGVSENTTSIFLESAYFNPVTVRKTAKRHGLNTDASFRFERGADPNNTLYALKRAAVLFKEIAGGTISSDVFDNYPHPLPNVEIDFSYKNCDRLIGKIIDRKLIQRILETLSIQILNVAEDGLKLSIPPFKVDVQREADVIEEILRIYGYNNIELPKAMTSSLSYRIKPDKELITNILSDFLVANGFNEILTNSLTKSDFYENKDDLVTIKNPLSKDLAVMRQTMIFNGLETILYNQNRKSSDLKLFEFGSTYFKTKNSFQEVHWISLFATGKQHSENWNSTTNKVDFYYLKGLVYGILEKFGFDKFKIEINNIDNQYFNNGLNYTVNHLDLFNIGLVNAKIQQQFEIDNSVYYAEINYDNLLKLTTQNKVVYKEVPKFPNVRRDLALLIDDTITYQSIKEIAMKQEKKLLKSVNLFDVYEGKNLPKGKKSYGVSFVFQDEHKTLTDKQIDIIMDNFITSFQKKLKAELR